MIDPFELLQNEDVAAACPVSIYEEDWARRLLDVPADHGCRFSVALGYPHEEAERTLRRRLPDLLPQSGRLPLESLVYEDRYEVDLQS